MLGIGAWDWLTLGVYLIGITGIGVWAARKISDTEDFFIGGRRFGKVFMLFFAFGAGTSGNDAVGVSSKTYTNGISGIWYQWLWLFATPFYWLIAPIFRRMRAVTTGDYFEYRYDKRTGALYAFVGTMTLTVNIGVLLLGSGAAIEAVTGGAFPTQYAIMTVAVLFVTYGIAGGLAAAIITDLIQGILTIVLSFIILPFAWQAVGGMTGLRAGITDPGMFSLIAPGEINLFHIVIFAINALVGIVTQPHIMGTCAGGRNEMDGQVGFAGGNLLKRVCTVAWMLTGLCGIVYFASATSPGAGLVNMNPDLLYGTMARELLPLVLPGLVGLFLAALLASIMSSCDAYMVSSAGLITQNIYRQYIVTHRPDRHYVFVGRVVSFIIVCGSIFFAFQFSNVPAALEWFFRIQAMMGPAFWLGLFWRRATVAGAWAATITAFALMLTTNSTWFHGYAVNNLPEWMLWGGQFRVSWQMFTYLTGGFATGIIVSLFTPRVPSEKLDRLYNCLRTPVHKEEPHLAPFTLPPGIEPSPPRKLIDHPDLEIPRPTLNSLAGFGVLALAVAGMIGFVYWLFA